MSDLYAELASTATELLAEFGMPVTIVRKGAPVYNADTGKSTASEAVDEGVGLELDYEHNELNNLVLSTDRKIMVAPEGITGMPKKGDRITVGTTTYGIENVKRTAPGGIVVLYEIQART